MIERLAIPAMAALSLAVLSFGALAQTSQGDPFQDAKPREGANVPAPSAAHWLIGRWEGDIVGLVSEQGTRRILTVHRVETDGQVVGTFVTTAATGRTYNIAMQRR